MSLYEKLGVDKTASPDQIKRAYRAKAKESHPDAGGSADEFAPVAHAYEVLSDPTRRLLYDRTGETRESVPIEAKIRDALFAAFNDALAQDGDVQILKHARAYVTKITGNITAQLKKLTDAKAKLERQRAKVRTKGEVNLFHQLIDSQIGAVEGQLAEVRHHAEIAKGVLELLDSYEEDAPKVQTASLQDMLTASYIQQAQNARQSDWWRP